jgi:hypothetical protein
MFSGELPAELVQYIREYSKPLFTHYKLFNQILRELRKTEWAELKEKLYSEDSETYVAAVQSYIDSAEYARMIEQSYYDTKLLHTAEENSEHREQIRTAEWRQYGCHRNLSYLVNGKMYYEEVLLHIRHRPYDDDEE